MAGLLEDAMRRIESGVASDADAKLVVKRLRECRSKTARWCEEAARSRVAPADQRPVAWAIQWNGDFTPDTEFCYRTSGVCEDVLAQAESRGKVVPLYADPQPAINGAEREAISVTIMHLENGGREPLAATLRSLLERM